MSDKCDVVVVGGGVIGLSCAWRLAQRGSRVTLCERGRCGGGASGASLGVLMPAPATRNGPVQTLQRASLGMFPAMAAELLAATGIAVGYSRTGLLEVLANANRREQAQREAEIACAQWPPLDDKSVMTVLDDASARALEPQVGLAGHGARCCRVTANVDVSGLIAALRAACKAAGVDIREGCAATDIILSGGCARGVTLERARVDAGTVLVAGGAHTSQLSQVLGRCAPVQPVRGEALLLHAPQARFTRILKRGGVYLVPRGDGDVLVGATTDRDAGFNCRPSARGVSELTAAALALVPALAEAAVVRTWAGLRPEPADRRPYLGELPGATGLYVATGHFKTGVGMSAITGRLMAELILDGAATTDLTPFALRDGGLPPAACAG